MAANVLRVNRAIMIAANERGEQMVINTITGGAFRATLHHFAVLDAFSAPVSIDAAIASLKHVCTSLSEGDIRKLVNEMRDKKVLVGEHHAGLARHDLQYFGAYQNLASQREMLMDTARTQAFHDALEEVVSEGDIVIDVGSGSGILSLFAVRAGARKVHSIERSGMINIARSIAEKNGYASSIQFNHCLAEDFVCDEVPNVIVSEWLGDFVLRELMFNSFCAVRDRCASPDTVCVPGRVRMFMAPVEDAAIWQQAGPGYWKSPVYGFDFSPAYDLECSGLGSQRVTIPETSLLSGRELVNNIDCNTAPVEAFYFDATTEFELGRDGTLHGFAGSFDMMLSPSVRLDTGSHSKETHWQQVFFPLPDALHVNRGDRLVLNMRAVKPENPRKRIPDMHIDFSVYRVDECVHRFDGWYDKARQGVF